MAKPKLIVGYGEDGKTPVMNGGFLLYMKDTIGLDIGSITIELLEEMGWAFDVISYFTACHLNPNYSFDKSLSMLISNAPLDLHIPIQVAVGYFLDHKEEYIKKYANQDFYK